ncbi:MAG TPA: hypothetical protein DC047_08350 [Blastocatellia bacterium]|nr:hypothetical protein [Blastocatellia bacterium]
MHSHAVLALGAPQNTGKIEQKRVESAWGKRYGRCTEAGQRGHSILQGLNNREGNYERPQGLFTTEQRHLQRPLALSFNSPSINAPQRL